MDFYDNNECGEMSKNDLIKILNSEKFQEKEIEKFIQVMNKNGKDKIGKEEFIQLLDKK